MPQRKLKLPVPLTILTGSLGVGKTTALCRLVAQKPAGEVWCCIVNEFGAVGIDAAAIESSASEHGDVVVKQIAGGCMCCVLSGPLSAAIAQIIRQVKPDRVLIEPSGLGHPGGLIDILQGPHLGTALQLNAVLCLVDLTAFDPAALMSNTIAADQITVSDILIGSKADAATPESASLFHQWADTDLFPPKSEVLIISHGDLDKEWLDVPRSAASNQLLVKRSRRSRQAVTQHTVPQSSAGLQHRPAAAVSLEAAVDDSAVPAADLNQPMVSNLSEGQPQQMLGQQIGQYASCSWIFHQDDIFDQLLLLEFLQGMQPVVARIKGVFRVGPKQWVMPSCSPQGPQPQEGMQTPLQPKQSLQLLPLCYRGPSMIEVIIEADSEKAQSLHQNLQQLLMTMKHSQHGKSSSSAVSEGTEHVNACGQVSVVWQLMQEALMPCLRTTVSGSVADVPPIA